MRFFIFFSLILVVTLAEKYTTQFDDIDVDQILKSDRLITNYVNCLLDKGKCSPDGLTLKKFLPDALATYCDKCSEKQKTESQKITKFLIQNRRKDWDILEAKYDPNGSYRMKYATELQEEGIVL